jgi:hypothetical protein
MSADPPGHTGPVQIRFHDKHVVVLCPFGHLVTSAPLDHTWAGSELEARISWHQHRRDWVVTCHGTLPKALGNSGAPT